IVILGRNTCTYLLALTTFCELTLEWDHDTNNNLILSPPVTRALLILCVCVCVCLCVCVCVCVDFSDGGSSLTVNTHRCQNTSSSQPHNAHQAQRLSPETWPQALKTPPIPLPPQTKPHTHTHTHTHIHIHTPSLCFRDQWNEKACQHVGQEDRKI